MPMARAEQYRNLYPFLGVGDSQSETTSTFLLLLCCKPSSARGLWPSNPEGFAGRDLGKALRGDPAATPARTWILFYGLPATLRSAGRRLTRELNTRKVSVFSGLPRLRLLWALAVPKTGFPGKKLWWPKIPYDSLPPDRGSGPARAQHSQVDFVVETSNALMCPVFPQLGQNVAQSI